MAGELEEGVELIAGRVEDEPAGAGTLTEGVGNTSVAGNGTRRSAAVVAAERAQDGHAEDGHAADKVTRRVMAERRGVWGGTTSLAAAGCRVDAAVPAEVKPTVLDEGVLRQAEVTLTSSDWGVEVVRTTGVA